jgi:hypothetical protein
MTIQAQVSALRQHLEQLFPGKWLSGKEKSKALLTGLPVIDNSLTRGLARQQITEWIGAVSSGKTTLLRTMIANWCASGFDVAYIDTGCKLLAADWVFVEKGRGRLWVIRAPPKEDSNTTFYAADQLIRCNAFDAVILDLGHRNTLSNRIYARLQRSLARSKAALIVVRDHSSAPIGGWGCHIQFNFCWTDKAQLESGINGVAAIAPSINLRISKEGLSKNLETTVGIHVSNRLYTHPTVPDRRAPET